MISSNNLEELNFEKLFNEVFKKTKEIEYNPFSILLLLYS